MTIYWILFISDSLNYQGYINNQINCKVEIWVTSSKPHPTSIFTIIFRLISDFSMYILWMFRKYFSKLPLHRNDNTPLESFLTHCGGLTNLVDELSRINLIYLKRKITSKQVQLHTVSSTWLRSKVDSRDDFIMQKMSLDLVMFSWKITFINFRIIITNLWPQ